MLQLSLVAIINSIKMNTLPKFLFLSVPSDFSSQYIFQKDRQPNTTLYMGQKSPQDAKTAFAEAQTRQRSSSNGLQNLLLGH